MGSTADVDTLDPWKATKFRSYLQRKEDVAAVAMLRRVDQEPLELLRLSPMARETIRVLVQRERQAFSAELRPMAKAAGVIE